MKTYCLLVGLLAGFLIGFPVLANAQSAAPLQLVQTISMPNVKGRIDHRDVDVRGKRLFVAGLENGSLEVVDLQAGKWLKAFPVSRKRKVSRTLVRSIKCSWRAETTGWCAYSAVTLSTCWIRSSWSWVPIESLTIPTASFYT